MQELQNKISTESYWTKRYQEEATGWDIGYVSMMTLIIVIVLMMMKMIFLLLPQLQIVVVLYQLAKS